MKYAEAWQDLRNSLQAAADASISSDLLATDRRNEAIYWLDLMDILEMEYE